MKTGDIALLKLQALTKNLNSDKYPIGFVDYATNDEGITGQWVNVLYTSFIIFSNIEWRKWAFKNIVFFYVICLSFYRTNNWSIIKNTW